MNINFQWIVNSVQRSVRSKLGYGLKNCAPYKNKYLIKVGPWPKFVAVCVACTIQRCNDPRTI